MSNLPKYLNREDLDKIKGEHFDEVIMLGIKDERIHLVSSCLDPNQTSEILEVAADESYRRLFPHVYGNSNVH